MLSIGQNILVTQNCFISFALKLCHGHLPQPHWLLSSLAPLTCKVLVLVVVIVVGGCHYILVVVLDSLETPSCNGMKGEDGAIVRKK